VDEVSTAQEAVLERHCLLSVSENLYEGVEGKPEQRNETAAGKKDKDKE
jgi:hypothetical protein